MTSLQSENRNYKLAYLNNYPDGYFCPALKVNARLCVGHAKKSESGHSVGGEFSGRSAVKIRTHDHDLI